MGRQILKFRAVILSTTAMGAMLGLGQIFGQGEQPGAETEPTDPAYVLGYEMNGIDGTPTKLSDYEGKVILIINTASRCGLTPQYEGLEKLYREKKDEGFVILGFPANNFRGQEPGSNAEIAEFCSENYDVTFPMFEKISVLGEDRHPLYTQLFKQPEPIGGEPEWNFAKYLVDREGHVVQRFASRTKPADEKFVEAIESLIAEETPET